MAINAQSLVRRQTPKPVAQHLRSDSDNSEKRTAFQAALRNTGYGELTRVRLDVDHGVVTLFGEVSSFYMKQLAQEAIRPLSIGMRIDNRIHVVNVRAVNVRVANV